MKGHWARQPPITPGWYIIANEAGYLNCAEIDWDDTDYCLITGDSNPVDVMSIDWWYSLPIDIPEPPKEEEQ